MDIVNKIKAIFRDSERRKELILYVAFGAATTVVNWVVYVIMRRLTGMDLLSAESAEYKLNGNICNITAWIISVLFAFLTNKHFVFQSGSTGKRGFWKELTLFVSARLLSLVLFDIGLYNLLLFVMHDLSDKLITNVLIVIFNYFASKLVIFRKKPSSDR